MDDVFRFNFVAFLLAFALGLFYVYIQTPPAKVIIQHPTPYNAGKIVYRDAANACFAFNAHRVQCTKDAIPQPVEN
jgi:hypothetical protein